MTKIQQVEIALLHKFQAEHAEWSRENFGPHDAWQPILGMIEELGEYEDAITREDVYDAIGDVMIYMCDLTHCYGWSFADICQAKRTRIEEKNIAVWGGRLAHYYLKSVQGIRGSEKQHLKDILCVLTYITGLMHNQAVLFGTSVEEVTLAVWENVRKRNWKRNTLTGCPDGTR